MEEHDHSAHAVTTAAAPGTIAHPVHGTWPGHVLPGSFFLIWSTWWMFSVFRCPCCQKGTASGSTLFQAAELLNMQAAAEDERKGRLPEPELVRVPLAAAQCATRTVAQAGPALCRREHGDLGRPHLLQVRQTLCAMAIVAAVKSPHVLPLPQEPVRSRWAI